MTLLNDGGNKMELEYCRSVLIWKRGLAGITECMAYGQIKGEEAMKPYIWKANDVCLVIFFLTLLKALGIILGLYNN